MASNKGSKAADQLRRSWQPSQAEPTRRRGGKARATFHLPADLLDDMRDTVVALSGPPHRLTMSKLAANALKSELERLRREGGRQKAFNHRSEEVTRGRPVG